MADKHISGHLQLGGPETQVKGIATTMFCTYDVVRRAAELGCNLIIPYEDAYWNDSDKSEVVSADPSYQQKVSFMKEHNIVVFRMHDHMHAQKPDFTYIGCARALGLESEWEKVPQSHHFMVPETTLENLAKTFQETSRNQGSTGGGRSASEGQSGSARRWIRHAGNQ